MLIASRSRFHGQDTLLRMSPFLQIRRPSVRLDRLFTQ
jgi:hypothetical protein